MNPIQPAVPMAMRMENRSTETVATTAASWRRKANRPTTITANPTGTSVRRSVRLASAKALFMNTTPVV
jgi:hypothetical protein